MSFKVAEKIGRPGTINRKPSGSIWKLTLIGGNGGTVGDSLVYRTQNGGDAVFLIPSEFTSSWQNGKVICKINSYLVREQSYAWSTGSGSLTYAIQSNDLVADYEDTIPIVEGTEACDPGDNNIISGGGIVLPQVQIKDTQSLSLTARVDRPTIATSCNRTVRTELLFTFPETPDDQVTVQPENANWLSNFNSYTIEKIN